MIAKYPAVFDGHNDLLARLWLSNHTQPAQAFLTQQLTGQIDFQRCKNGNIMGGLFAIFVPPFNYVKQHHPEKLAKHATCFSHDDIRQICQQQLETIHKIEDDSSGQIQICRTYQDLIECQTQQKLAVVIHLEGAEVIHHLDMLDQYYQAGLRSIGPLWNEPNQFGHGLKASFPHSPDTGLGLTDFGRELVKYCQSRSILVDVSHMNERAFWDCTDILTQPLVATHSNAHALCPQARNLTNTQLEAIRHSQGFVGINLDTAFLRADGQRNAETSFDVLINHILHIMHYVGEDHIGFGSDFDGGFMSNLWSDVSTFPEILKALEMAGFTAQQIEKIAYKNWFNVLKRIWKS